MNVNIKQSADQYAVIGYPIEHSKSPFIHTFFAQQTMQNMQYRAISAPPGQFIAKVEQFFQAGGKGLNVTLPYKQAACHWVGQLSDAAKQAGAVNTLILTKQAKVLGDNTDGIGLVRDMLSFNKWPIKGCSILILGAGGAVRGILGPLAAQFPSSITVANRTLPKALQLQNTFAKLFPAVSLQAIGLDQLQGKQFELIINGTSMGLQGQMPALPDKLLLPQGYCYDLAYGKGPTPFQQWGHKQAARASANGLGMLVEQAAAAFSLWRGINPETNAVRSQLLNA